MIRVHFKDDGQDILWWDVDAKGVVQRCNMQETVWKGTRVVNTLRRTKTMDIRPGDTLVCEFRCIDGQKTFIHPVEKVGRPRHVRRGVVA